MAANCPALRTTSKHERPCSSLQLRFLSRWASSMIATRQSTFRSCSRSDMITSYVVISTWQRNISGMGRPCSKQQGMEDQLIRKFYARQHVLAIAILSVRLDAVSLYRSKPRWDRLRVFTIWYHRVSSFLRPNFVPLGEEIPSNKGIKERYLVKDCYVTATNSPSVRTVPDRHGLAAYHNKHCWRAFWGYQHQWLWMTLNLQNRGVW